MLTRAQPFFDGVGNRRRADLRARGASGERPLAKRLDVQAQGGGQLAATEAGEHTRERGLPEQPVKGGDI
jgi:hypothetical protein